MDENLQAVDETGFDMAGNGIYWFWDTNWTDPHV